MQRRGSFEVVETLTILSIGAAETCDTPIYETGALLNQKEPGESCISLCWLNKAQLEIRNVAVIKKYYNEALALCNSRLIIYRG